MCFNFTIFIFVVPGGLRPSIGLGQRHELCEWGYWEPADASERLEDQSPKPSSPIRALGDH